ncbi:MAG: hypothetical protein RJA34_2916 [Pseudomonadota bacterium]|jgi:DNA polymerase
MSETGLQLDARQRAMLAEMGIKLWWPDVPSEGPSATEQSLAQLSPASAPAAPGSTEPTRPLVLSTHAAPVPRAATPVQAPQPMVRSTPGAIGQMDWPALQQAVAGCRACKLCESRTNTVFGAGQAPATPEAAPQADWLIVGEAPGEQEDMMGEPFVGPSGQLLDNMLKAMGLNRQHQVFITNVLKCRPPANRNPDPGEVAQCAPYLQRQIELLQPKIILAMGRFAVQSLLQTSEPIGRLRGRLHQYHGVPVVVTYHPAYLLRNLPDKAKAWADLCLAMETMGR